MLCGSSTVALAHQSSSSALKRHKWLPASARPTYRLLCLVRNILHSGVPPNLANLLQTLPVSSQQRRSHSSHMLVSKRTKTSMRERAFSASATREWNMLPAELREPKLKDEALRDSEAYLCSWHCVFCVYPLYLCVWVGVSVWHYCASVLLTCMLYLLLYLLLLTIIQYTIKMIISVWKGYETKTKR